MKKTQSGLKERFTVLDGVLLAVLIIYTFILLFLFYWAIVTSFKSDSQFYFDKISLPTAHAYTKWKEYLSTVETGPVWNFGRFFRDYTVKAISANGGSYEVYVEEMVLNTVLYAIGCAFINTLIQCTTAYVCAKFPCKISNIIYTIVIVVMIIPIVGNLPAEIQLSKDLGIFDSIFGQWIMKANFLGLYFLVFFATFKSLPDTYSEAGKVDGASNFYIMTKISLPLVRNEFLTILIINFIAYWNDYQIPLLYLPSYPTIAYGIYDLSRNTSNWDSIPMRMTGAVAMLLPILALFLAFHKRLLGNLTVGGIKG